MILKVPDGSPTISQNSHLQENTENCGGSDGCDGSPPTNFSINPNNCEKDVERTCTTSKTSTLAQNSLEEGNTSDGSEPSENLHFNHQPVNQGGAGDNQSTGEVFSEGDRVTHSSMPDEGRIFVVTGFKEVSDGEFPFYVLAREEDSPTAVVSPFNPFRLKKLSSN